MSWGRTTKPCLAKAARWALEARVVQADLVAEAMEDTMVAEDGAVPQMALPVIPAKQS